MYTNSILYARPNRLKLATCSRRLGSKINREPNLDLTKNLSGGIIRCEQILRVSQAKVASATVLVGVARSSCVIERSTEHRSTRLDKFEGKWFDLTLLICHFPLNHGEF